MKDELPRQQFAIAIQAMVGSKVFGKIFVSLRGKKIEIRNA